MHSKYDCGESAAGQTVSQLSGVRGAVEGSTVQWRAVQCSTIQCSVGLYRAVKYSVVEGCTVQYSIV